MLIRELTAEPIYLACGHTDMRKSIDGLAALVISRFHLDPHQPALFLFCGRRKDRIKGLLWDETSFLKDVGPDAQSSDCPAAEDGLRVLHGMDNADPAGDCRWAAEYLQRGGGRGEAECARAVHRGARTRLLPRILPVPRLPQGSAFLHREACQAHALCWAHARRYFVEAIPPDLQKENLLGSICKEAIERVNELFAIDKKLAELTKEKSEEQRLQLEKEKLEAYFAWLQDIEPQVLPKSKFGKAVQYSLSHKEALQAFLKSGNAALSNNICECAIRNFAIGRKN
ncbi:IS66 family insertion sequence element accessory protein TnpB [Mitsuokella sp. AF21-1AC]|uniref:IS66 family insertion sequence element accessory protein TnpB n=1 Tax=Mitsuokella sp. AF21-1AC TaxID=2292235 RepID=UPI000E47CDC8|nr:IS66 family insertion sequence element accessory protein TnpB [Mitsuokella sp. AF21-1AC]RGS69436.1 hypothetical protein DWX75_11900 [Mitsuokella sp. AF21-1AC]